MRNSISSTTLPRRKGRGINFNTSHVEYSTIVLTTPHCEMSASLARLRKENMVYWSAHMDIGAILVVAATDGPYAQTREHIL